MNALTISLPDWVEGWLARRPTCTTEADKMRLCIELARANVEHDTGGPFGAAVYVAGEFTPLAVGVNAVIPLNNSVLHAEVMALMFAESRFGAYSLREPPHELFTSCEPCAMCLGAILGSGVRRLVCGADRAAAAQLGFEEGPVFPESYAYLQARGVAVERGVLGTEVKEVFELYRQRDGVIYNG
jgi:tRNA(Arg) A34 adenosine deaminase TadA